MNMNTQLPQRKPETEAKRLLTLANDQQITSRLLGGVAISILYEENMASALQREYKDLDFVCLRKDSARWSKMLEENGYESDVLFNSIHGYQRLLHFDRVNGKQLDTFVEEFAMCQSLELKSRLGLMEMTLAPMDLLLTKLQIFEINDKDLIDVIALLLRFPVGQGSSDSLEVDRLRDIAGEHWGWHTTLSDNLAVVRNRINTTDLPEDVKEAARSQVMVLTEILEQCPKSIKWKARSKVGRRLPWYDLPEEVE